jgi:sulfur-oxidizing protein SoxX
MCKEYRIMTQQKIHGIAGYAMLAWLSVFVCHGAVAETATKKVDYASMGPEALAEYLIFDAGGFSLDQQTQEGGTVRQRLAQDELQKTCSALQGGRPEGDTATQVIALAREALVYPEGGISMGDWNKGEQLARSGYGFRVGHKTDDHSEQQAGGNCYACHQLDPEEIAYGTLGPSLTGYGKLRGTSKEMQKYTYEVIYNAHAYFPCTKMPRFGANGFLTREQIADVMAYLMHSDSPVNK